jgi:acyl-CoA thioesterase
MSDKNHNDRAKKVIDQMYYNDAFSLWLGIERIEESAGYCKLRMQVRKEMLNGFKIAHGGISFSLADQIAMASMRYPLIVLSII